MYPDGTVTDTKGAILGSSNEENIFTSVTHQEEVGYRAWRANGGQESFAVWKNSGKPLEPGGVARRAASVNQRLNALMTQGHGPQRHEGDVTLKQLEDRCVKGIDPMSGTTTDAVTGRKHKYGRHATKVKTPEDYVYADNFLRNSEEFKLKEKAFIDGYDTAIVLDESPLEKIYGNDYATKVDGRSRIGTAANPRGNMVTDFKDSTMKAVYRKNDNGNWDLITMYPEPK